VARASMGDTGLLEHETALTLDWLAQRQGKRNAVAAANRVLSMGRRPIGWYCFFGPYGTGKSSILKILTAEYARRGLRSHYTRAEDMLTRIRDSFSDNPQESERQIKTAYGHYQFLAIDEVDRISNTGWAKASMMMLLDERYRKIDQYCTVMATNTRPAEFPAEFDYLKSRMQDAEGAPVFGEDLRGKQ